METGETKQIKEERLKKLADLYQEEGKDLTKFLSSEAKFNISQTNNEQAIGYSEHTYHNQLFEREREFYEKRILHLEGEIGFLRDLLKQKTA